MDMVSPEQDYDPGTTYSGNTEHNSGFRVSPTILQESMEDHTTDISTDTSNLGLFLYRPLRRQDNEIITKIRVVDAGPRRSLHGCTIHSMEPISESLRKSSLESHLSGAEQDQTGTASLGDSGGAVLAECFTVPFPPMVSSLSAMDVAATSGGNNIPQDSSSSATAELDALRVVIIRQQLVKYAVDPKNYVVRAEQNDAQSKIKCRLLRNEMSLN
ncbi:hypothetical protein BD408DRAFT_352481 [Parasitella parasitica]|nr:hypothetical protein BD408DRAFT_352481 [Parasitella parasitica]